MCHALFVQTPYEEAEKYKNERRKEWMEKQKTELWNSEDPAGDFALAPSLGNGEAEALT